MSVYNYMLVAVDLSFAVGSLFISSLSSSEGVLTQRLPLLMHLQLSSFICEVCYCYKLLNVRFICIQW